MEGIRLLQGFLPFEINTLTEEPGQIMWCNFEGVELTESFFVRDVYRRLAQPGDHIRISNTDVLLNAREHFEFVEPSGFIFHMSGCGSTFICNLLRKLPGVLALGEPNILTQILRNPAFGGPAQRQALFRNGMAALGQTRSLRKQHMVIKFSSFSALWLSQILTSYPDVPCLFLFRDPVEVLASNMKTPHQDWILDPQINGMDPEVMTEQQPPLMSCAKGLVRTLESFLAYRHQHFMVADYAQMSPELVKKIALHFQIDVSHEDWQVTDEVWKTNAKNGGDFTPDTNHKQNQASEFLKQTAQTMLYPLTQKLEALKIQL